MGSSATASVSRAARPEVRAATESALVWGCMSDALGRRRIQTSLKGHATVEWFPSFVEMRRALETEQRDVGVIVMDVKDPTGAVAPVFARWLAKTFPGVGVIAYKYPRSESQSDLCALGAAGVHDILLAGVTDEGYTARSIILDARRRGAADAVMAELAKILPLRLHAFAEAVVRYPANSSIAAVTRHLSIHRQTPNFWCKKERYPRPEELLVWCRLFVVGALLELTPRTLDSIANELDYASPTVVRNQMRRYSGLTATQVRQSGFGALLEVFARRVETVRASAKPERGMRALTIG
jgi:hypothetical protein